MLTEKNYFTKEDNKRVRDAERNEGITNQPENN